ncbi:MAG: SRPBCC family protein [Solirubrobacterales bacterium]
MSSWKQQALIEAPVERVWELLEDPARYAEWNQDSVAVTGVPTRVEKGSTFTHTGRGPLGMKATTTFEVTEFEDLREIKLRCQTSGYYSHWTLTEARGSTFADIEFGVEPLPGLQGRALSALQTKGYLRRALEHTLDSLRRAATGRARAGAGS